MNKIFKTIAVIAIVLAIIAFTGFYFVKKQTKKGSPQGIAEYVDTNLSIKIVYCQPYKKGRIIFGTQEEEALQLYDAYWRLGANEATTLETNRNLIFGDNILKKGKYSIYAVPGKLSWKFGFNSDANRWGASEPDYSKDLFTVEVPVTYTSESIEQFNININSNKIVFNWDTSLIKLPFKVAE